jgi:4-amino-4-deoxy-L-arabinose transferase-like glycosyltransferase
MTAPLSLTGDANEGRRRRWYLQVAVVLLLVAAFFRLWNLGAVPPGLHAEELTNAQISDRLLSGQVAIIYDQVSPAREGLYYALLAAVNALIGRGLILWRLPSVWIALLSLAITTQLMRRLFGVRVSLMALGLMAVTFWPVWMGRTVQHVALLPLATSLTIYTLVRAFEARDLTRASLWFTLGGLALGLSQYVHVTAWTLLVLFVAFVVYHRLVDPQDLRRRRGNIIYALVLALVLMLPLFIYIGRHPGVREPVPVAEQPGLILEIPGRLIQAVAALVLRGDLLPQHNLPGRPVLGPVIGGLMAVGIGVVAARFKQAPYGLALLWMAIGLIPAAFLPQQPDFEFMAVIMPVVFVFPAIGLRAIFEWLRSALRTPVRRVAASAITGTVVALILANAAWTYRDYFITWPSLGDVRLNYQADLGVLAHYLDTSTDPTPISICSTPVDLADDPFALPNRELLSYFMHRSDLPVRYFDCTQSLPIDSGGEAQRIIFPRGHYYDYLPGPLLAWMRYASSEQIPGIRPDVVMRLDVSQEIAAYAGVFTTAPLAAWPPEAAQSGLADLPATFGYNVSFLGYEVRDERLRPGDLLELTTYWRVDGPPPPRLTVFAHLLGTPVVVLAQQDRLGVDTSTLQVRDLFIQYSVLQIPGGAVAGDYPLSVGLYLPETGERLPVFVSGSAVADRLMLRSVRIER